MRTRVQSDSETQLSGSLRTARMRLIDESQPTLPTNSVADEPGAGAKEPVAEATTNGVGASNGRRVPQLPRLIADWPPSMLIQQQQTSLIRENGRAIVRVNVRSKYADDRSSDKDAKKQ